MTKEMMQTITNHFNKYFNQEVNLIIHPMQIENKPHVDILFYKPNEQYPFYKMATMGASEYIMPQSMSNLSNRNEYIMFIHPDEKLDDKQTLVNYASFLLLTALMPIREEWFVTWGHSIEFEPRKDSNMICAYLGFPEIIQDTGILKCYTDEENFITCLQVTLITKDEMEELFKIGQDAFDAKLYPDLDENPHATCHFLSELNRTDKF